MNNGSLPKRGSGRDSRAAIARAALTVAALAAGTALVSCQSADKPSFPANPTDSGSRYSDFGLPGSEMEMQNTDLED